MKSRFACVFTSVGLFTLLQVFNTPKSNDRNLYFWEGFIMLVLGSIFARLNRREKD